MSKKVLVYGATGSQAMPTVRHLIAAGHEAYAVTRDANTPKCDPLRQLGATLVEADMGDLDSLRRASAGMDAVALMIPAFIPNPMDYPRYASNAIQAAQEAGVGLIVYNTGGAMADRPLNNPVYDLRLMIAGQLAQSGVPYIILQTPLYMENLLGPWTAPGVAMKNEVTYPHPPELRAGWIASDDVGKLVAAAVDHPELASRRIIVSGVEHPDGPELAAAFSQGLGRPITYREMPLDEFAGVMDKMFGPGAGQGAKAGYQFARDHADELAMTADMGPVLEALPVQMTTIAEWVAARRSAFGG
jgi:uncharacterized protein YbjT (DUF2867 family)